MSHVVRVHSTSDIEKPPAYSIVNHKEVICRGRELRSDKPEILYDIGTSKSASATDDTLTLALTGSPEGLASPSTPSNDISGEISRRLSTFQLDSPEKTAAVHDLREGTSASTSVCPPLVKTVNFEKKWLTRSRCNVGGASGGPREPCIYTGFKSPHSKWQILGEMSRRSVTYKENAAVLKLLIELSC